MISTHYTFGSCELSIASRELTRDGNLVAIEPKALAMLCYLIVNRDRAVDKNELQDQIWPGTIVTEGALTRCVMKVRRAIGDDDPKSASIKTVRGHGYRFSLPVVEGQQTPTASANLDLPDKPSLAVLPFINLSNNPEQEYFSDGITEDVITELSRFRSLFVIGRHSSFSYKGRSVSSRDIARELGVAYLVDGSLQRSGDRIRINVRLVDAEKDAQMWSERFDRNIEDILVVQEEVAATVAATVGGRVEATRGRKRVDRAGLESYDCLLRAQALYYNFAKESNAEARELLQHAVTVDPNNARALAILAAVHSMDSWSFWVNDTEESRRLSLEIGKQSIELDDTDSLAHALFAEILFDCDQPQLSNVHFRRAIELNPNDIAAHALYASKLRSVERIDEALEHIETAERLDPFGLQWIPLIKGSIMYASLRYDDAVAAFYSMAHMPIEARYILIAALGQLGRIDEARHVRQQFFAQAKQEMPAYPGEALADWVPVFDRMLGCPSSSALDHTIDGLRLSGWN
jgi:TolB-like protein/Flp pilus assembly protein TadD